MDVICLKKYNPYDKIELRIRVWRRLVARLNGVQEAVSSTLATRTKEKALKTNVFKAFLMFFILWTGEKRGSRPVIRAGSYPRHKGRAPRPG